MGPVPDGPQTEDSVSVIRALQLLREPGDVVEVRALGVGFATGSEHIEHGFFNSSIAAAEAAVAIGPRARGVYATLNQIKPELFASAPNQLVRAGNRRGTSKDDIERRTAFYLDCDPVRPPGSAATEEEKSAALDVAQGVVAYLAERGWPEALLDDSGNGYQAVYRIDLPTDDGGLVKRVLTALSSKFDNDEVTVDLSVADASRLFRLPGTFNRKGHHATERPWRLARIVSAPEALEIVPRERLEEIASMVPVDDSIRRQTPGQGRNVSLQAFWVASVAQDLSRMRYLLPQTRSTRRISPTH